MKKLFTLLTLMGLCISGAWADDQVLNATVSATYINAGNADTNYSGGDLYANYSKVSGGELTDMISAYGGADITIVKFDASDLPSGASVKSAVVTFKSQCTVSNKNSQLAIVPIGTNWNASEATWNNVDKSANGKQVVSLEYSNSSAATTQTYDAKTVFNDDEDKIIAFAIFTNTGRQQKITDLALTVTYTEEALNNRNYTVNAVCGSTVLKQLATGSALENDNYSVSSLPYVVMTDGICYTLDDEEVSGYSKSYTMPAGSGDVTNTVSYSESDITYFFEAESILSKSYGNSKGAYSGGVTAGVYTGAALTMSSIAAGVYTATVNTSIRRANDDQFTVQVSTDGTNWTDAGTITLTSSVGGDYSAEDITLPGDGSIRLVEAKGQNMCHYVDYVTLRKSNDYTITKTLGDTGFGTFSAACNVLVPEGITVYNTTLNGETIVATPNTDVKVIPANTGVIVQGEADTYTFTATTEAASDVITALTAAVNGVTGDGSTTYGLLRAKTEFAIISADVMLPSNYAYLSLSGTDAKSVTFVVNDSATAISNVNVAPVTNNVAYNLAGQRVNANAKGVVIINGKKYLNK